MNAADPVAAVARVLHADGTTAGSSFLVTGSGLVATCAHVVTAAGAGPGGSVRLAFQLAGTPLVLATVLAEGWRAPDGVDVAFLQLSEPVSPAGSARPAAPLELRPAAGSTGNRFLAYGFPPAMGDAGMFGYGVVGGVVRAPGKPDLLQLTQTTETTPGFSGGPVIDQVTGGVIGMITSIVAPDPYGRLTQTAFATPAEVLAGLHPDLQVSAVCPYRSLDVFEMEHARFFCGRDTVVTDLLARLRVQPRFLALLGPSGSGKSSLLRAGLLSRLREDGLPGSAQWGLTLCRPSDHDGLLDVLASLGTPRTGAADRQARTLVAIDQFEEIFALDEPVRGQVAVALLGALSGPAPVSVVLTMRDDFFSRFARDLPELMNDWLLPNAVNVPASLPEEAVRDIVTQPAQAVGLRVDDDLVDAVLADLPRASDGHGVPSSLLPVIESALTQLWHERDDGWLTTAALRRLGGVSGSLARTADDAYYALPPEHRLAARRILTRLVHLGEERLEVPDTRQVALLDDLQAGPEDQLVADVLSRLVAARLVVARRDQVNGTVAVELIHDALLREWGLLRQWLSEDRAFFAWRQWLDYRMGDWREDAADAGQATPAGPAEDSADLLRGRDLAQASQWLTERGDELVPRQRAFIGASLTEQRRRLEAAEAAAVERERAAVLDVTQRLTVQAADVGRLLPVAPARALAAALAATGANVRDLGGEPLAPVQNGLHLAVRTALERLVLTGFEQRVTCCAVSDDGLLLAGGGEDRTARLWAVDRPGGQVGLPHDDAVTCMTFLPGSRPVMVTGSADGAVQAWTADGRRLPWPRSDHEDAVTGLAVGLGGTGVVSASADGSVRLRDASGMPVGQLLLASSAGVAAVAASPDGSLLVTAGLDGVVGLWELDEVAAGGLPEPRVLAELDAVVPVVAFHPDGALVAFGDEEGQVHLRRLDGSAPASAGTWSGHGDLVTGLAFSPDGTLLVSGALDGRVLVRDVLSGARVRAPVPAPGGRVLGLAVDGNGQRLVGACGGSLVVWDWLPPPAPHLVGRAGGGPDRALPAEDLADEQERDIRSRTRYQIMLWDRAGDQQGPAWTGHRDTVYGVAVTADGHVASAGGDRAVLVRDGGGRLTGAARAAHGASITAVAASPVDPVVATAGRDGVVRLWTTGGGRTGSDLRGHALDVMAVAFSPDGRLLLTGSRDGTARLWQVAGSRPAGPPITGHEDDVVAVAFHPSGDLLVTGSRDATVRLWTLAGEAAAPPLEGHRGFVAALAVSPDGDAIASGGGDGTVRLWRPDGAAAARPFVAHSGPVHAVRFTDGGRLIVTAGHDGTVGVWDRSGGAICEPMCGHEGPVWSLAVTPDGGLAVTGGADTTVRLWRLGTWRDWLREGCERLRQHPLLAAPQDPTATAVADACATGGAGDPAAAPVGRRW